MFLIFKIPFQLPNDTVIEVWMGEMADVSRAIGLGYKVLYATCWYLDHIEYGTKWTKYYQCDPVDTSFGKTFTLVYIVIRHQVDQVLPVWSRRYQFR